MEFFDKEELIKLLGMTDVYVHSSDAEIEAISCIEAVACGNVPIIANSVRSATPQFALDERSLFEAGNSDDLANKIDYWIEHEEERQKMQLEYAKSAEKYRISKSMEQMEGMFLDAIRESRANV
ncbi:MAG: glycosyltransferase [Clostridia bacterium]